MYALYVVWVAIVGIIGCVAVVRGVKKRNIRQQKKAMEEWNRKVNALCLVTEQAAIEELALAGKTLHVAGMWFDIKSAEFHLPDVFWSLDQKNIARTLITVLKACIKDYKNNAEPEDSSNNQQVINACIQGLIKVLTSRARIDPGGALGVMRILSSPGQSPEDSINSLLRSKPAPRA